jgi:hypothetical protein
MLGSVRGQIHFVDQEEAQAHEQGQGDTEREEDCYVGGIEGSEVIVRMVSNKQTKSNHAEGNVWADWGDALVGCGTPRRVGGADEHEDARGGDGQPCEDEE